MREIQRNLYAPLIFRLYFYMQTDRKEDIPFVDLYAQYLSIQDEIDFVINDVIKRSLFVRGEYVEKFEDDFSKAIGVSHCISCANGTDSLYIAMKALGVAEGDEVIVPAQSWISTSETVTQAGGRPIFCDIDLNTFTIDPHKIEEKITNKTVGIIPVHLYGQPADMVPIMQIANKHRLWVLEDCAQAHLAKYHGQNVGTFGVAASFSFYPGKNLGAMGDAGSIVTNDNLLAEKMTMFARHGGLKKGDHQIEGINSRLDGLQAAILSVKLPHLFDWTASRQRIAGAYTDLLEETPSLRLPIVRSQCEHVWHLFTIRHSDRDLLAAYLKRNGVQTSINYHIALPFLPAYSRLGHTADEFPSAYINQTEILSLPIYPEISKDQIFRISNLINSFAA
jgi:dTDP-4-amino-4,6-dideoxygalactose transaminase